MSNYAFRNVSTIGEPLVSDNLEANIACWLNWNLLGTSAFFNINYATEGSDGGLASQLRMAHHNNYTNGRVWEGFRKQWIWQSGINNAIQPIQISGVKVNGTFYPSNTSGAYAHTVDYPNGRVIFDSPIATNATVLVEHSFNYFQVYTCDNPWWSQWQRNSFRVDDAAFLTSASGIWHKPPQQRIQLPAIVVEATTNFSKTGYELGSLTHKHKQEIKIHIITESRQDLKWMVDVIGGQNDAVLSMFDKSQMIMSGVYPISMEDGSLNPGIANYPDTLTNYPAHNNMMLTEFRSINNNDYLINVIEKQTIPFYFTSVRLMAETFLA